MPARPLRSGRATLVATPELVRRAAAHVIVGDVGEPVLDADSLHHLVRVLRLRDGATVTVTDGAGAWRKCRFAGGDIEPDGEVVRATRLEPPITIAVATPKGDRAEWLVQKCTEIGVDRIALLAAARSVVHWDDERAARHVARLRRVAAEAAMQSRRVWLPELTGPHPATAVLPTAVVAEPGGRALAASDTTVAIGPEGGWSPDELALAADTVTLGPNILRVETAAVVATALMVAARTSAS